VSSLLELLKHRGGLPDDPLRFLSKEFPCDLLPGIKYSVRVQPAEPGSDANIVYNIRMAPFPDLLRGPPSLALECLDA
jgi:hypothetical protein